MDDADIDEAALIAHETCFESNCLPFYFPLFLLVKCARAIEWFLWGGRGKECDCVIGNPINCYYFFALYDVYDT